MAQPSHPGRGRATWGGQHSLPLSIPELIEPWVARSPDAPAFLAPGREPLSYKRLYELMGDVVHTLRTLGIQPGDRVAVALPEGPELAAAFLCVATGAVFAPLNPALTASEFEHRLRDLPAQALIAPAGTDSPAVQVAGKLGVQVIRLELDHESEAGLFGLAGGDLPGDVFPHPHPGDDALLMYTSGTTSRPKLVPLTHENLCTSAGNICRTISAQPLDRCLNVMPLFHVHALMSSVLVPLASGGSVVLPDGFDATRFLDWVREFRPAWYSAAPTIHQSILARVSLDPAALEGHSLRFIRSAAAPLPPALMEELESVFQVPVIEFLGMTEAAQQIAANPLPPRARKSGSVGLPAGPEVVVIGDGGEPLPPGEVGEIAIRGQNVTRGYDRNPAANEEAFQHGWLRTGDEGYFDGDGYLYVTGRRKEMIIRGGENISPREVEEALLEHPDVSQAVAFAIPHRQLGQEVGAAVVVKDGAADETALRRFVAEHLVSFKVPRLIRFLPVLPKGSTGKLDRIGLSDALGIGPLDDHTEHPKPAHVAPRTSLERRVAEMWCEILAITEPGIHDRFLDLGGDSLMATRLLSRVRASFGVDVSLVDFFDHPSIAAMARAIAAGQANPPSGS